MPSLRRFISHQNVSVRLLNFTNVMRVDIWLILNVLALAVIGWILMYSVARSASTVYLYRMILFFCSGVVVTIFFVSIDYRFLVNWAPLFYLGSIALLLVVLFFGTEAKGSERWINLGLFRLQPSEFSKIIMIFFLTWYLTKIGEKIRKLGWFVVTFFLVGIPLALILKQPNLGTAASLAPLVFAMLYVAGCRKVHLVLVLLLGSMLVPVLWLEMKDFDPSVEKETQTTLGLKHYQKKRIYAFLHPEYDYRGTGWHTYQSKITIGSGGISGKGYLRGTQTKLKYLPEHHTDFIFSLLAEEFGFVGGVMVIALFAIMLFRGLMFARDAYDMQGTLLAVGVVTVLAFHIFVNIAITTGLLPVTGIPLPFLSYGGSFYMTVMAGIGILLNVPLRKKEVEQQNMPTSIANVEVYRRKG
ncbi:MAG TPA: rod shape-determining protein RodA [Candidatus Hydrogenedentes bacterium]|nr:rod shape-determining protein RodA [Candidatus Hydrogenedentota bacterium]HOD96127.1 rod shape-determining protein RodA [Candidatus Hydrogenedentota bacterium]HOH43677.1 rod shape-determining protein RodA [Candidatus Hydrogenedentota bacterium]HOM47049.1 rod shape-determining protein RodA [Candidatus Hydrogenedentota bacterium]HOR49452.1 rod shape-determining protein RodA [Candidatus Hydrogenedentota bacterium]